jgi:hypothetical protein
MSVIPTPDPTRSLTFTILWYLRLQFSNARSNQRSKFVV